MRKLIILIIMGLSLSACIQTQQDTPEYLLHLVPGCTGFAVDKNHYMTAAHCADDGKYATTIYGQVLKPRIVFIDNTTDIAIISTDDIIKIEKFAEIETEKYLLGKYYGSCPLYMSTTGRASAYYRHADSVLRYDDMTVFYNLDVLIGMINQFGQQNVFCGGDSGGIYVINGKVRGMGIIVDGFNLDRKAIYIYVVPSSKLKEVWENYRTPTTGNR